MYNLEEKKLDKRIDYIDTAKGIAITLMVIGHSYSEDNFLVHWLYSFHMPFFFIISGYLYAAKYSKVSQISFDINKKVQTLILPYFVWGTIYQFFLGGLVILGGEDIIETLAYRIQLVLGFMSGATWFLPAMFIATGCFFVTKKRKLLNIGLAVACLLIGVKMPKASSLVELFLRAFIGYAFICIGFYGYNMMKKKVNNLFFIGIAILSILSTHMNVIVDMAYRTFGNPVLYIINSVLGSWIILQLCMRLEGKKDSNIITTLKSWGRYSIVILCLHSFVIEIIRLLDYKIFGSVLKSFGILEGIVLTLIVLTVITIIMPWVLKYLGWTWGYNKKTNINTMCCYDK